MSALRQITMAKVTNADALRRAMILMNKDCQAFLKADCTRRGLWDRRDTLGCAVVLSKEAYHGAEDIGWVRNAQTNEYTAVLDVDDLPRLAKYFGVTDFVKDLANYCTATTSQLELEKAGYTCTFEKTSEGLRVVGTSWV